MYSTALLAGVREHAAVFNEYTYVSLCNMHEDNNAVPFSMYCVSASLLVCRDRLTGRNLSAVVLHMQLGVCGKDDKAFSVNLTLSCVPFPRYGVGVDLRCGMVMREGLRLVLNVCV